MTADTRRVFRWLFASLVVLAALGGLWFVANIKADEPAAFADVVEHFKYGSIGSEPGVSLLRPVGGVLPPYWIFKALPLPRHWPPTHRTNATLPRPSSGIVNPSPLKKSWATSIALPSPTTNSA